MLEGDLDALDEFEFAERSDLVKDLVLICDEGREHLQAGRGHQDSGIDLVLE